MGLQPQTPVNFRLADNETSPQQATGYQNVQDTERSRSTLRGIAPCKGLSRLVEHFLELLLLVLQLNPLTPKTIETHDRLACQGGEGF